MQAQIYQSFAERKVHPTTEKFLAHLKAALEKTDLD
jgi:hypothetical protein